MLLWKGLVALSSNLLWDAQVIRRKKIPTVQDALICCDEETLMRSVEKLYASRMPGWQDATPQQRRVARKRLRRSFDAMKECPVKRKDGRSFGLFPEEHFVVQVRMSSALIERVVRMRLVDMEAAELVDGVSQHGEAYDASSIGLGLCSTCSSVFGYLPWSVALSYRIWLEGPWDCHERYMALANVYWQLTHQGFGGSESSRDRLGLRPLGGGQVDGSPSRGAPGRTSVLAPEKPTAGVDSSRNSQLMVDTSQSGGSKVCRVASASELRVSRAANMGLLAAEALEESYIDKLISRVDCLNEQAQRSLEDRIAAFFARRAA